MAGTPWETFGIADPPGAPCGSRFEAPTSRPLKNERGQYDWAAGELSNHIACIEIRTHGDCPGGAFVRVGGDDQAAVEAAYERTTALVRQGALTPLFGGGE